MNQPNVVVISHRQRPDDDSRQPGYVGFIEAEDVLLASAGADAVMVSHSPTHPRLRVRRLAGRLYRRATTSKAELPSLSTRLRSATTSDQLGDGRYDLAVLVAITVWDLPMIERLYELRRRADQVAVWFPEVWPSELDDERLAGEPFDMVDHIFVGVHSSAPRLSEILNRPVHYLPMAADVARFAPLDPTEPRPIDVLGIGRREPELHQALIDWSRRASKLYVYDTISGQVPDYQAHRENLADTYRRSSIAITNHAKFDHPDVGKLRELPGRLWEGLASGAVMVGRAPDPVLQEAWPGRPVVIDLPADTNAAVELIDDLHRGPVASIRGENVTLALRRNDWGHRWRHVFDIAGLTVPTGLQSRIDRLAQMADTLDQPG